MSRIPQSQRSGAPPPAIAVFAGQKVPAFLALPRRPFGLRWMFFMTLLALAAGVVILLPAAVIDGLIENEYVDWQISERWMSRILFATAVILSAVAFLALPRWLLRRRGSQQLISWRRPRRADFGWALIAVGVSWGTLLLYDLIVAEFGSEILRPEPIIGLDDIEVDLNFSHEWLAFYAFLAIIAAPLAEEGFFRGFLLGGLRRARRRLGAADRAAGQRRPLRRRALLHSAADPVHHRRPGLRPALHPHQQPDRPHAGPLRAQCHRVRCYALGLGSFLAPPATTHLRHTRASKIRHTRARRGYLAERGMKPRIRLRPTACPAARPRDVRALPKV